VMSKGWKDQRGKERWPEPEPDVIQFFGLIQGPAGRLARALNPRWEVNVGHVGMLTCMHGKIILRPSLARWKSR
jgi:hypothetical protein